MKRENLKLSKDEAGILIAFAGFLFGSWARIYPVWIAGFPINDGGLFYRMTEVLRDNDFRLPGSFIYNGLEIPFAYPPLGFYIAAVINTIFDISLLDIFRFLPAIILILTIPAFFDLARVILKDNFQAGIATLVFALTPRSITWFIMGGGVTRSLGLLFLILALRFIYIAYKTQVGKNKNVILAILSCSLVVLSHPEASLHTAAIALILWLYLDRSKQGLLKTALIGGGTLLITAIWWLPLLLRFGFDPFLSAAQTGLNGTAVILYPFLAFNDEPYITFVMVLAFIGLMFELAAARYLIPILFFLPFLIEVRSAANVAILAVALAASSAISNLIVPGIRLFSTPSSKEQLLQKRHQRVLVGSGIFLIIYMLSNMLFHTTMLSTQRVNDSELQAFDWIIYNTDSNSKFLVITGRFDLFRDWTMEWFPTSTNRISLTTIQGREWSDGDDFQNLIQGFQQVQNCLYSFSPLECIDHISESIPLDYDYIFISTNPENIPVTRNPNAIQLKAILNNSAKHELVFNTAAVVIFGHHP